jgi:hypothetical protein
MPAFSPATSTAADDRRTVSSSQSALAILLVELEREDAREPWDGAASDLRRYSTPQVVASRDAERPRTCARAGIAPFDAA